MWICILYKSSQVILFTTYNNGRYNEIQNLILRCRRNIRYFNIFVMKKPQRIGIRHLVHRHS